MQLNYHIPLQYGETALHIAYKKESYKVQELLISEDADDTIQNNVSAIRLLVTVSADLLRQDSVPKMYRLKPLKVSSSISSP